MPMEKNGGRSPQQPQTDVVLGVATLAVFALMIILGVVNLKTLSSVLDAAQAFVSNGFGWFYNLLVSVNVLILAGVAVSRYGNLRLGALQAPEFSTFSWLAIIFCTAIASGSTFWAPAEPLYHLASPPPLFPGVQAGSAEAAQIAMAYAWHHWGPHAWLIYALFAIIISYAHYHKGLPMRASSAFYLVLGEKRVRGPIGRFIDGFGIVAVVAGLIAAIGFLVMQLSSILESLFRIPGGLVLQFVLLAIMVAVYTISCVTGVYRGIKVLSNINAWIAIALAILVFLVGPTRYLLDLGVTTLGTYFNNFFKLSFWSEPALRHSGWLNWWTVFYWAWWIGWGPNVGMFVARVSRGRTIREIVLALLGCAFILWAWFDILGGAGLFYDMSTGGSVGQVLKDQGLQGALLAIIENLPGAWLFRIGFMAVLVIFLITTCDSVTLSVAMVISGLDEPPRYLRITWAMVIGATTGVLLAIRGGVNVFQSGAIITALPVAVVMALGLAVLAKCLRELAEAQSNGQARM